MKHVSRFLVLIFLSSSLYADDGALAPVASDASSMLPSSQAEPSVNFNFNYQPSSGSIGRLNNFTGFTFSANPADALTGASSLYLRSLPLDGSNLSLNPSPSFDYQSIYNNSPYRITNLNANVEGLNPLTFRGNDPVVLVTGSSLSGPSPSLQIPNCRYTIPILENTNFEDLNNGWNTGNECFEGLQSNSSNAGATVQNQMAVCNCLSQRNILVRYSMNQGELKAANGINPDISEGGLQTNVNFLNRRMFNLQGSLLLQTSILSNSSAEARELGTIFNNNNTEIASSVRSYIDRGQSFMRGLPGSANLPTIASTLTPPNTDRLSQILTDGPPLRSHECVSVKEYLAFKQVPSDENFYRSLASESFNADDWDIDKLQESINSALRSPGLNSPEYKKIRSRITFLNSNGLWRAVFSSNDQSKKEDLHKLLKETMGSSTCHGNDCRLQFLKNFDTYRRRSREFLPSVSALINTSETARARREFNPERADADLRRIGAQPSTNLGFNNFMYAFNPEILACASPNSNRDVCRFSFAAYCPQAQTIQQNLTNPTATPFTPNDFEYESLYNCEMNPDQNPEYQAFNASVCGARSSRLRGREASFGQFERRFCRSRSHDRQCNEPDPIKRRRQLVSEFIQEFPRQGTDSSVDISDEDKALREFLGFVPEGATAADASSAASTSRPLAQTQASMPNAFQELGGDFNRNSEVSNSNQSVVTNKVPTSPASAQASLNRDSSNSNVNGNNNSAGFVPLTLPDSSGATSQPITRAEVESTRAKVRESDSEISKITDQISTLRDDIRGNSQTQGFDQNSPQYRDLMDRMTLLERSNTEERARNTDLKRQLAQAEARVATPAPASSDDDQTPRSQSSRAPASVAIPGNSTGVSSGAQSGNQVSAQAQLSSPSVANAAFSPVTSSAQATRISGGQLNTALLSKYNVQSITSQGAIIVADPNPSIDLQQLRSDSSSEVLRLTFSEADVSRFSQDEGRALSAYMDQVSSAPGEVVRVLITLPGSSEPVERFVLKSQGRLSIVPPPAPVARAPASGSRYRLSDLVNELQVSR